MAVMIKRQLSIFIKAFDQCSSYVEVRPRRVGGSVYQIPTEVRLTERVLLAFDGLLKQRSSRSR